MNMLYDLDEIRGHLERFDVEVIRLEKEVVLRHEGRMHNGKASVIQGKVRKLK